MNQTEKLLVLACLVATAALAAGCVPALNYGSVPPEPKYTTKVTTTTATSATKKPFTTPKPRTGTISWEELNGPMPQRNVNTESPKWQETYSYTAFRLIGGDDDNDDSGGIGNNFARAVGDDEPEQTEARETDAVIRTEAPTEPPQTAPPQTEAHDVYVPPQEDVSPPEGLTPALQPGPPAEPVPDAGE